MSSANFIGKCDKYKSAAVMMNPGPARK